MLITIFTPTYNRGKLLPRLYESIRKQTVNDFEWIIVDDGSTDDTEQICKKFANEKNNFSITYIKQLNGGKHRAVNRGVKEAKGKLFFIADSDDMLLPRSIEIIFNQYQQIKNNNTFGGICGLDCYKNSKIVGNGLVKEFIDCNSIEIRYKYKVVGDLKEVFYTHIIRKYPFPEIKGERFVPEALIWNRIAKQYKLRFINQAIYQVEYQDEGLTKQIIKIRMKSPIASMMTYAEMLEINIPFKQKLKAGINYWRFRWCYKNNSTYKSNNIPIISWKYYLLYPLGWLMHINDLKTQNTLNYKRL